MSFGFSHPIYLLILLALLPAGYLLYRRSETEASFISLLRLLPAAVIVLGLAGPYVSPPGAGVHTVYLLDASSSVTEEQRRSARRFVLDSTARLSPPDSAALILFGEEPRIAATGVDRGAAMAEALLESEAVTVETSVTNLAAAIREAPGVLPRGGDRRVVLLSDGVETRGAGAAAAALLQEEGIRLSTVYLPRSEAPEDIRISGLAAPKEVEPGDLFELAVTLEGSLSTPGTLRIYREDELLGTDELRPGGERREVRRYRIEAGKPGIWRYRGVIEAQQDGYLENNSATTAVAVRGARPVLYLADSGEGRPFRLALETQGIPVTTAAPEEIAGGLLTLANYESIVIDDLPATRFPLSLMRDIEGYVRDTGGGLIVLGGPHSFGAGGYGQTPLEEALPVSVDITSKVQVPTLAMIFVVDKSGSMGNSGGRASKLDIVKEALLSSVEVMHPNQLVGLLSFDADVEWSVPITRAAEREQILRNVARLREGGGTILGAAMNEAARSLEDVEASTKHLIILSDGLTREADFIALTRKLSALGATVSTVSIGSDADKGLLESIAVEGGGRYYHTDDTTGIPRIFTEETSIVARNVIVEETFFPGTRGGWGVLAGIPEESVPPLRGFVMTYPKGSTRQLMDAPEGHPLLAAWQYGLGRSIAFTSSIDGLWGGAWSSWELLPRLAGQLVDWASRTSSAGHMELSHQWSEKGTLRLSLEVTGTSTRNGLSLEAIVSGPGEGRQRLELVQTGPGRYTGEVMAQGPGSYLITVHAAEAPVGPALFALSRDYPEEYALSPPNPAYLERLGRIGGGISAPLRAGGFPHGDVPAEPRLAGTEISLAEELLIIGMVLFVLLILGEALASRSPRRRRTG